jgi:VanZ family protein
LAWACFVLFASSSNFSASNPSRIIRPLLVWLFPEISEAALAQAHFLVRKAAHFTEYALLALLAARAFRTSSRAALARHWRLAAFALVASVALVDEYHQSFYPSRGAKADDVFIDAAGVTLGLLLCLWRRAATAEKRESPDS